MLAGSNNITPTPRLDHAQYLNHWVELLAHQPGAIMRAASLAESAADYLAEAKQ
jgi:antirestriction protein ArdC